MTSLTTKQLKNKIRKAKAKRLVKIVTKEEYEGKAKANKTSPPAKTGVSKKGDDKKGNGKEVNVKAKAKTKRGSLIHAINKLINQVGIDKVTYTQMEKVAKQAKSDTKFGKAHYYWYLTNYHKNH